MTSRIARTTALLLPVLLVGVLASTGGWRIHDGRVERVAHVAAATATPVPAAAPASAPVGGAALARDLSPSVPWPAWAGLILLCLLPAMASMRAWSGTRRDPTPAP